MEKIKALPKEVQKDIIKSFRGRNSRYEMVSKRHQHHLQYLLRKHGLVMDDVFDYIIMQWVKE